MLRNVVQYLQPGRGAFALDIIANFEHVVSQSSHAQLPAQNIEPSIEFKFEVKYACVPPALIACDTMEWNGRLYIGSLSAVISESWLRWAGVTHIVCVCWGSTLVPKIWRLSGLLRTRTVLVASRIWIGPLMHRRSVCIGGKSFFSVRRSTQRCQCCACALPQR